MLEPLDAAAGPHFSTRHGAARLWHDGRDKSIEMRRCRAYPMKRIALRPAPGLSNDLPP